MGSFAAAAGKIYMVIATWSYGYPKDLRLLRGNATILACVQSPVADIGQINLPFAAFTTETVYIYAEYAGSGDSTVRVIQLN